MLLDAALGPPNEGWRGPATTTLAYERGTVAKLHLGTRRQDPAPHRDTAKDTPIGNGKTAADDPHLRQALARVHMEGELLKLISERGSSAELDGRAMGPEGSIAKLLWSEAEQHITEVASDVLGPDVLATDENGGGWARDRLQPGAHDRRRYDPSEQEHRRPKAARASGA